MDLIKFSADNTKYTKWYIDICTNAIGRGIFANRKEFNKYKVVNGYLELHHIFPSCFCNKEQRLDKNNLVALTTKEHFLVHLLLSKMFANKKQKQQMLKALGAFAMDKMGNRILNSRQFSIVREAKRNSLIGRKISDDQKLKQSKSMTGKISWNKGISPTAMTLQKMSDSQLGRINGPATQERKDKISAALTGKIRTKEHCKNLSKSHKGLPSHTEKPIIVNDIRYRSIRVASESLKLSDVTIRKRLKSMDYPNYIRA